MPSVFEREKVQRLVIDPMVARWQCPRGADPEVLAGDYIDDLHGFSEETLQAAFLEVRRKHEYQSWPASGKFRAECISIDGRPAGGGGGEVDDETRRAQCRTKAVRMAAELTGQQKYLDAGYWRGAFMFGNREIEDRIYRDLMAGGDGNANVTQADIARWSEQAERAKANAKEMGVGNLKRHMRGAA